MSHENVEVVREAIAAANERDVDGYLACCADDVQLFMPNYEVEGVYEGAAGVRRYFGDVEAAVPDLHLEVERMEPIGLDRVLVFLRVTGHGRASGIASDTGGSNIYELSNGKIERLRVYRDRDQALEAAGLSE